MKSLTYISLLALPVIILATFSLLYFGALAPDVISSILPGTITGNVFIDIKLKYQLVTLLIAFVTLGVIFLLNRRNALVFYKPGDLAASSEPVKWLGINTTDTWKSIGRNFSIVITVVTGIFVFLNVVNGHTLEREHIRYLPLILVFAALNAFTEEAITRLSLVTVLHKIVPNSVIYLSSTLLFGIPHYFGVPGGLIGSIMAAFLGWLLAKSIVETKGIFWAWFIHFLQDVVIFTGLFIAAL